MRLAGQLAENTLSRCTEPSADPNNPNPGANFMKNLLTHPPHSPEEADEREDGQEERFDFLEVLLDLGKTTALNFNEGRLTNLISYSVLKRSLEKYVDIEFRTRKKDATVQSILDELLPTFCGHGVFLIHSPSTNHSSQNQKKKWDIPCTLRDRELIRRLIGKTFHSLESLEKKGKLARYQREEFFKIIDKLNGIVEETNGKFTGLTGMLNLGIGHPNSLHYDHKAYESIIDEMMDKAAHDLGTLLLSKEIVKRSLVKFGPFRRGIHHFKRRQF